ncbi:hypothetical protein PUN28_009774 [Cardiocondyla obscurior]|uniref:Uncharacterized protein n=1 Tax=Cardiocondyla obscurior TaxID=286306 RepID=A0AAW2FMR6_9HYME
MEIVGKRQFYRRVARNVQVAFSEIYNKAQNVLNNKEAISSNDKNCDVDFPKSKNIVETVSHDNSDVNLFFDDRHMLNDNNDCMSDNNSSVIISSDESSVDLNINLQCETENSELESTHDINLKTLLS